MQGSLFLVELGAVVIGLAVLARLAGRVGIPAIPLYLTAGLAFGEGGILPLVTTQEFVEVGAEIGLILLLFMLGLEYTAAELLSTLRFQVVPGICNILLNFLPGFVTGLLLGWSWLAAVALGGITYATSSGIVAKVLSDLGRLGNRETPTILSLLVFEDLSVAVYLPLLGGLLVGDGAVSGAVSALAALALVALLLFLALRVEVGLSRMVFSHSDEALLLTIVGLTLLMAGIAERFHVSAGVAALLVGIMLSGPAAAGARALLSPLRDLFAALFFAFVGFGLDPADIPEVLLPAAALAVVGAATKLATGWIAAARDGIGVPGRLRAGATLIARGEFSIAIAGITAHLEPDLGPLAVTYVFLLAVAGPLAARLVGPHRPAPA